MVKENELRKGIKKQIQNFCDYSDRISIFFTDISEENEMNINIFTRFQNAYKRCELF